MVQLKADPSIGLHLSGAAIAKLLAEEIGRPDLFKKNVAIEEQKDAQMVAQDAEADALEELDVRRETGQ